MWDAHRALERRDAVSAQIHIVRVALQIALHVTKRRFGARHDLGDQLARLIVGKQPALALGGLERAAHAVVIGVAGNQDVGIVDLADAAGGIVADGERRIAGGIRRCRVFRPSRLTHQDRFHLLLA